MLWTMFEKIQRRAEDVKDSGVVLSMSACYVVFRFIVIIEGPPSPFG